jgi:hypothetical protein
MLIEALKVENRKELEEKFASYWISYPKFKIFFNGNELHFDSLIKNTEQIEIEAEVGELTYKFIIKILEWNFENKKKTYLCNAQGIPFQETSLGLRSSIPISIFIQSVYIENLHRENTLDLYEADEVLIRNYEVRKGLCKRICKTKTTRIFKRVYSGVKTKRFVSIQRTSGKRL